MQGVTRAAHVVLATFAWAVVWWLVQPIPIGITAMLPLVVLPFFGLMSTSAVSGLYGQPVIFWMMGMALLGWGMERHGLAKRFALGLLSIKGVASTTRRVAFVFMLATSLISLCISDIAVIAMTLPIGASIASFVSSVARGTKRGKSNFATLLVLASLYGAVAGGIGTIAGVPFNAISISLLRASTGKTIGWFEWMARGMPTYLIMLVGSYFLLCWMFPPEIHEIAGGEEFMRSELGKLGKLSRAESNVLFTFVVMVVLFLIAPVSALVLGARSTVTLWLDKVLEFWIVPPVVLLLLYLLPVNLNKKEFTLNWKEAVDHVPWGIILLTISATSMMDLLGKFGFLEYMRTALSGFHINIWTLPLIALLLAFIGNFMSAIAFTTVMGGIFIPAAAKAGFDVVTMTMLVPNLAIGLIWPGAGPISATIFASGKIGMRDMMKVGAPATILRAIVVVSVQIAFLR